MPNHNFIYYIKHFLWYYVCHFQVLRVVLTLLNGTKEQKILIDFSRSPLESLSDQSNHFCPGQFSTREWVKLSFKIIKMINNFHGKYKFYVTYILEF